MEPEFLEAYRAMNRLAARVLGREPEGLLKELAAVSEKEQEFAKAKGGYE